MNVKGKQAIAAARDNPGRKYPGADDPRCEAGMLVPALRPGFRIDTTRPVFTIGSCFAREIEEVLLQRGVPLPLRSFSVPESEWPYKPSALLNEYHPGTMHQRILAAYAPRAWTEDTAIEAAGGFVDLLMSQGGPVARERLFARRRDVDAVYAQLPGSDVVVITLGFVEAWRDERADCWLNRAPPPRLVNAQKDRYRFVRFEVDEAFRLLEEAVARILDHRPEVRVLLTVSPVPLQATFSDDDCVVANAHSKAVLRVCATRLAARFAQVDYFPSYEMVASMGAAALRPDLVHVRTPVIERLMDVLFRHYVDPAPAGAPAADTAAEGAPA